MQLSPLIPQSPPFHRLPGGPPAMELSSPLETPHLETPHLGPQTLAPCCDYSDRAQPSSLRMLQKTDRNTTADTTPATEGAYATSDSSLAALTKLCNEFLESMTVNRIDAIACISLTCKQARFGKDSQEVTLVIDTLRDFRVRKLSKREALSIISSVTEDHHDLIESLMRILYHGASSWSPEDFDLPPAPQFLQPAHELQMRLPSVSTLWQPDRQLVSSNPTLSRGYGDFERAAQPVASESFFRQAGYGEWQPPTMPTSPVTQTLTECHQFAYGADSLDDRSNLHGYCCLVIRYIFQASLTHL